MPDHSIDAIKVARAIQKNELSILDGKEFKVRDKINKKKRRGTHVKKPGEEKMTLAKLAKQMNARFDHIDTRINNLEKDVKDINARLDRVENRLDYIVDANNLKDSK